VRQVPGSLQESLSALEEDDGFLLKGDVFTGDVIDTWTTALVALEALLSALCEPALGCNGRARLGATAPCGTGRSTVSDRVTLAASIRGAGSRQGELRLRHVPNFRSSGRAGSAVPRFLSAAARRSARRSAAEAASEAWDHRECLSIDQEQTCS
jgi:hypothetical protein